MILTLGLSVIIGLLLGLLGGGGSILMLPMLVYLLGIDPKNGIVTSFVVVGVSSLIALIPHAVRRLVCWKSGVFFGLTGMLGAFGGGRLASQFSGDVLMTLFGLVCLAIGMLMIRPGSSRAIPGSAAGPAGVCPLRVPYLKVLFDGFFVGVLTGTVGVGGGFLIVPALTLLVGLPIQGAIGTSLLVIVMNAVAGLSGYSQHVELDVHLTLIVAGGAIAGSAMGSLLAVYVKPKWLRRAFGTMVVLVAGYVLSRSLSVRLFDSLEIWADDPQRYKWALAGLLLFWLMLRISRWIHKSDAVFLPEADAKQES
ncbi:MAG: sulfite exporter TauE/SafE family protein [Methylococcales bacterium]|nr:sulfite exporter TauE/SafE family protein [Methylococcales bacterium]